MKKNYGHFIVAFIWFIVVTILLCIPGKKLPTISWFNIYQIDKLVHFVIFFILSSLFCRAVYLIKQSTSFFGVVAFLCSIYGMMMEFVQEKYIPNRSFDAYDIVADAIGSFAIFIALHFFSIMIKPSTIK